MAVGDSYLEDYEILTITTTDDTYNAVTFSQPVKVYKIRERDGNKAVRFRKAEASGDYITIWAGMIDVFYCDQNAETVGYVARDGAENVTVEVIGFF